MKTDVSAHWKRYNEKAKEEFRRMARNENFDFTEIEMNVVDLFFSTEEHLSIQEIHRRLEQNGTSISEREIESIMDLLMDFGFARRRNFEDRKDTIYEHRHLTEHHDHMICIKCNRVIDFFVPELEQLQASIADSHHFRPLNHNLSIYGICGECQGRREPVIPLSMAVPGEELVLREIRGGERFNLRLAEMGLTEGTPLQVVTNSGQVIISVRNSRVAIGRGMASKILVSTSGNMGTDA